MKPIYKSVVVAVITTASLCISADALARDIYVNNQIGSDFLDGFSMFLGLLFGFFTFFGFLSGLGHYHFRSISAHEMPGIHTGPCVSP